MWTLSAGTLLPCLTAAKATGWSLRAFIKAEPHTHSNCKIATSRAAVTLLSQTLATHSPFLWTKYQPLSTLHCLLICLVLRIFCLLFCLLMVNKLPTESHINVCKLTCGKWEKSAAVNTFQKQQDSLIHRGNVSCLIFLTTSYIGVTRL